jgi:hypothetical protein
MMLHPLFALLDVITMPMAAIVWCSWRHYTLYPDARRHTPLGQEISVQSPLLSR